MTNKQTNGTQTWFHPDVPRAVRNHLLGEKYSNRHKFIFGTFISLFGVCVSHFGAHLGVDAVSILLHHVGYGIHGVGYIPMYKAIETKGGIL